MQFFMADDGARLAYRDEGEGLPVLALSGLTRDGLDFDYLARHLTHIRLIRLDYRGRGASAWTGSSTYTVARETQDVLQLLDHLQLQKAAIIGSSRGGLIGMVMAATARDRLLGLCLNDVGPVLEREALVRIGHYVGVAPLATTLSEIPERLAASSPGFRNVSRHRWEEETARHFVQTKNGVGLRYDPALRVAFLEALDAPPADLWPLFDACEGLPLALIRGRNTDLLSLDTVDEMRARRPDLLYADVPDRGHIPFLDEPEALDCITSWLGRIETAA